MNMQFEGKLCNSGQITDLKGKNLQFILNAITKKNFVHLACEVVVKMVA